MLILCSHWFSSSFGECLWAIKVEAHPAHCQMEDIAITIYIYIYIYIAKRWAYAYQLRTAIDTIWYEDICTFQGTYRLARAKRRTLCQPRMPHANSYSDVTHLVSYCLQWTVRECGIMDNFDSLWPHNCGYWRNGVSTNDRPSKRSTVVRHLRWINYFVSTSFFGRADSMYPKACLKYFPRKCSIK